MTKYLCALATVVFAMGSSLAFAQEAAQPSAIPVIKDGQCYDSEMAEKPAENQEACRAALGKNDEGAAVSPEQAPTQSGG